MYEIQITRAGINMSHDKAAEFIANGYRVTVMAVSGPHSFPSDYWAEIKTARSGDRARVSFTPLQGLDSDGASTVGSIAVVAAEVAMKADKLIADREAAIDRLTQGA